MLHALDLSGLQFGLLALGDRQYPHYCGFGRRVDGWLIGNGARALFERVDVDAASVPALRRWQQELGALTGIVTDDSVLPAATQMHEWRLLGRDRLNPGSVGGAIWRIRLAAPADVQWQAGDILHIAPRHNAQHAGAVLKAHGLDPLQPLLVDGHPRTLLALASERELPEADAALAVQDACLWLAELPLLPSREYSIASCTDDGMVELVVRLVHDASGRAGLGSGWLSLHAPIDAGIVARASQPRFPSRHWRADGADRQRHRHRRVAQPVARSRPQANTGTGCCSPAHTISCSPTRSKRGRPMAISPGWTWRTRAMATAVMCRIACRRPPERCATGYSAVR